jgi:NitT/TauT family transport system substrate-binding protein
MPGILITPARAPRGRHRARALSRALSRARVLSLLAAASLAAAGCGSQHPAAGAAGRHQAGRRPAAASQAAGPAMVVAAVPAPGAAALYLGAERGLFRAAGLDVRIEPAVSASDTVAGLASGSVAVVLGQWTSALDAAAAGVGITVIGPGNNGGPGLEELVTVPGSGVTSLSGLRGKTIAVNALSGLPQALTDSLLAAGGVPATAVRYTAVPFPEMAAALRAHRAAAAFMVQPYLRLAGGLTVLADADRFPATRGIPVTGYFTSRSWAAGHRAELARFAAALRRGQQLAAADPAAARQAIARYTGISPAAAAGMPLGTFPASVTAAALERVGDLMRRYGLLTGRASVTALATGMTS